MFLCGVMFLIAPFCGWWLPLGVSTHAGDIDRLFYIILAITGFFFILTDAILVGFMWKYAAKSPDQPPHVFRHHAREKKVCRTTSFKRIARPASRILLHQHCV